MKKIMIVLMVTCLIIAFGFSSFVGASSASNFPNKTVTLVCPYGAGGGTDALSRKVAELSKKYLGQEVIVVNKTGGMGAVALVAGANEKPDGYVVTMATIELVLLNLAGLCPVSYKDYKPLLRVNADPAGIMVRTDSKWETLNDLVEDAKKQPGEIVCMSGGFPGNFWLSTTMFCEKAGIEFNQVVSKSGAASSLQQILGGHVDAITITPAEADSHFKSGELRLLAVGDNKRYAGFPEAPTYNEAGYDVEVGTWRGLLVPKDTPQEICDVLEDAFTKAIHEEEYQEFLEKTGFGGGYLNSADFLKLLEKQTVDFKPIIEKYKK